MTDRPFMPCPDAGHGAPAYAPEIVLDDAHHKHVRVGPLEFCYRLRRSAGWTYTGAVAVGSGAQMSAGTFSEAFSSARSLVQERIAGVRPAEASGRCPDCGQRFGEGPAGTAPFLWACQRVHSVVSADGWVTAYEPYGRQTFAPLSPGSPGSPRAG